METVYLLVEDEDVATINKINGYNEIICGNRVTELLNKLIKFYVNNDTESIYQQNQDFKYSYEQDLLESNKREKKSKQTPGFVYIFECENKYKIGFTKEVNRRYKELNNRPYPIRIVFSKYFDNALQVEQKIHNSLNDYRIDGEWYKLTPEVVVEIEDYLLGLDEE